MDRVRSGLLLATCWDFNSFRVSNPSILSDSLSETGTQEQYPHLKEVLGQPIKWEVIRQQYDQMVKYASALKTGTADADAVLNRL